MKIIKEIKKYLNNENGGPNLDAILGITLGFILTAGIWAIGRALWYLYYDTPVFPAVDKEGAGVQSVVVGTQK